MALLPDNALKIILPAPYYEGRLAYGWSGSGYNVVEHYRQTYYEAHKHEPWFEDTKGWYHDPEWKYRVMSIQCAHDGNHPIWKAAQAFSRWSYVISSMGPLSSLFLY